jgi:hypothetical protein
MVQLLEDGCLDMIMAAMMSANGGELRVEGFFDLVLQYLRDQRGDEEEEQV